MIKNTQTHFLSILTLLIVFPFLWGCGDSNDSDSDPIPAYTVLSGTFTTQTQSEITGTGNVTFNAPLSGTAAGHGFKLTFTLQDGGSLTLSTFATAQLGNGVDVVFTRSGSNVNVTIGGATDALVGVGGGTIKLNVDVHNDESPAHVLIWTGSNFSESAAATNTDDPTTLTGGSASASGAGTAYGLKLANASVTGVSLGDPNLED